MMSASQIADLADQAARRAKRAKRQPFVFESQHHVEKAFHGLPNLGSYRPKGWALVEHRLVDKYGIDDRGPAMTIGSMLAWFKVHLTDATTSGYALVEESEFQVVIGRFEKPPHPELAPPYAAAVAMGRPVARPCTSAGALGLDYGMPPLPPLPPSAYAGQGRHSAG